MIQFQEKAASRGPGWVNAGVYLLRRSQVKEIPPGRPVSLERDVFPQWVRRGLVGYQAEGRFLDIGTPESYAEAERFFAPPANDQARRCDKDEAPW